MKPPADFDGFSNPVWMNEGDFVVRLRKADGTMMFDREQAESWYNKTLGEVFDHIKDVTECSEITFNGLPKDPKKHEFQKMSMNCIKNFYVGEHMEFAGLLKSHITVQPVHESVYYEVDKKTGKPKPELEDEMNNNLKSLEVQEAVNLPIDRFWQSDTIMVHVYILTARNITRADGSRGKINPYLYIE